MKDKEKKEKKDIHISVRVTKKDEIEKFQKLLNDNRCSNKSELVRRILFGKPLKVSYYDASREELNLKLGELIFQIRKCGININQIVKVIRSDTSSNHLARMITEVHELVEKIHDEVSAFIKETERRES